MFLRKSGSQQALIVFFSFCGSLFVFMVLQDQQVQRSGLQRQEALRVLPKSSAESEDVVPYEVVDGGIRYKPNILQIAIVVAVETPAHAAIYEVAISTVACYAKIHDYKMVLAVAPTYDCLHKDPYFQRHCVVAKILPQFDAVLFLDADIGVVFPKKRIEEYMDERFDVIFYDRFYNWEVMAGSYIVRNTAFGRAFLMDFADFEKQLPASFHGTDNGALHLFLAQKLFPAETDAIGNCNRVYKKSANYADLFTFEACIRAILGAGTDFGKVRIMKKGLGWARDGWLTNNLWSKDHDFMLHGWKTHQLRATPNRTIGIHEQSRSTWLNPLVGSIDINKCSPKNMSWTYDTRLIVDRSAIVDKLRQLGTSIARDQMLSLSRIGHFL